MSVKDLVATLKQCGASDKVLAEIMDITKRAMEAEAENAYLKAVAAAAKKLISHFIAGNEYNPATIKAWCDTCGDIEANISDKADEAYKELWNTLAALTADIPPDEMERLCEAWLAGRVVVLPVPIGAPIYTIYQDEELDGSKDIGVEELHLSGYIKEDENEFYTTYDEHGTCDIPVGRAYTTRAEAEAALKEADK